MGMEVKVAGLEQGRLSSTRNQFGQEINLPYTFQACHIHRFKGESVGSAQVQLAISLTWLELINGSRLDLDLKVRTNLSRSLLGS